MRNSVIPEYDDIFYNYVKNHNDLSHIEYGNPVPNQKWIGVMADPVGEKTDGVVIDPDLDQVYYGFFSIKCPNSEEAKAYIESQVKPIADNPTALSKYFINKILKRMKKENIQAEKVYVGIGLGADRSFFDSIEGVE